MFLDITNKHNVIINPKHFYKALSIITSMVDKRLVDKKVSLVIVSPNEIQKLNQTYRGKNSVTDVLSFPLIDVSDDILDEDLGEIFICYTKVYEQAKVLSHSIDLEWQILFVHGMWHLLGYDHITDKDYIIMNTKETQVLDLLKKDISL